MKVRSVRKLAELLTLHELLALALVRFSPTWLGLGKIFSGQIQRRKEVEGLMKYGYPLRRESNQLQLDGVGPFRNLSIFLRLGSSDRQVLDQVLEQEEYKPVIELIQSKGEDPITIVDAGANIGLTTLYFMLWFRSARVIAIEPDPGNCAMLYKNLALNRLANQVSVFSGALWDRDDSCLAISTSFRDGKEWSRSMESALPNALNTIRGKSLSSIVGELDGSQVDLLKIDIEGAEVLLFADQAFRKELTTSVKFIIMEIHSEVTGSNLVLESLLEMGFNMKSEGESVYGYNTRIVK